MTGSDASLKIAISSSGPTLESTVDPRFGRCAYFIIVDTENMKFESLQNASQYEAHGAGIQAAQTLASKNVKTIVTGRVGPNAYQSLSAAGIQIVTGATGTIKEAIERYKRGELENTTSPTAPMHYGIGGGAYGMGGGRGGGMGTGRGRGMGRGMTSYPQQQYGTPLPMSELSPQMTKSQEIQMLKNQMGTLQDQLKEIKKRLKELEK